MSKLFKHYILSYKLNSDSECEYMSLVSDLYNSAQVQSLEQYEQHLDINRLQHVTSVSYLSYKIAKKLGWDYKTVARGTLLHDLFYYDWRDATGDWHRPHGYKHPKYAYHNAIELNENISEKEKDMIKHHMFPFTVVPPRFKESYIIIFTDKYCAWRELYYSLDKRYKKKFNKLIEE